jgi:SRSO17 transposase
MQIPIVAPAPLVSTHAAAFRDLFANRCQFRHFQEYLTGLMVLDNKSLSNMARCVIDSADKTNLSRFLSEAPWDDEAVNARRIAYLLAQTGRQRRAAADSALVLDDTLCEHVGSLFAHIDRHYNHGDGSYPLAHNPVTSFYVSGPVRFPVDVRLYRRYEELTRWAEFVAKHFPDRPIPTAGKARAKLRQQVEVPLLADPEFHALHDQFQTKIALGLGLVKQAITRDLPFGIVLMDSWYLAEEVVTALAGLEKDWVSLLKSNRTLETASFVLKDADGRALPLAGPHIQAQKLVPLIPRNAYRPVVVGDRTYWCFTLAVRVASLGKVRLVISFDNPDLTGSYALLVTNRADWSAQKVVATYLLRWPVETFYQDGKTLLGWDEYRMRSAEAIAKHWCLVCVAYSFLHLACLPPSLAAGSRPVRSSGAACRDQAPALLQALILKAHALLCQGQQVAAVFAALFAKLGGVPT